VHQELLIYVNSVMNEFYDLGSRLYEGMVDKDDQEVEESIRQLKKMLTDVQRSYSNESEK
jgi:hypothetical protein